MLSIALVQYVEASKHLKWRLRVLWGFLKTNAGSLIHFTASVSVVASWPVAAAPLLSSGGWLQPFAPCLGSLALSATLGVHRQCLGGKSASALALQLRLATKRSISSIHLQTSRSSWQRRHATLRHGEENEVFEPTKLTWTNNHHLLLAQIR